MGCQSWLVMLPLPLFRFLWVSGGQGEIVEPRPDILVRALVPEIVSLFEPVSGPFASLGYGRTTVEDRAVVGAGVDPTL